MKHIDTLAKFDQWVYVLPVAVPIFTVRAIHLYAGFNPHVLEYGVVSIFPIINPFDGIQVNETTRTFQRARNNRESVSRLHPIFAGTSSLFMAKYLLLNT